MLACILLHTSVFSQSGMLVCQAITAGFAAASALILFTKLYTPLNQLLAYGKVAQGPKSTQTGFARLVQIASRWTVPKQYFVHFYILFAVLQWLQLPWAKGKLLHTNFGLAWLLLTAQATRRLMESLLLTQWGSKSRMHISHYFVGLYFYVCVAIVSFCGLVVAQEESKRPRQWLAIAFFALFSVDQYNNHRHLAALVKYSVPTFGMFRHVACAHYCDEIVIYFAVTVAAWTREPNMEVSVALFSAWVFVLVNLSVSGLESLRYYQTKFDDYTVQYAVVPFLL
ncbi:hypothetical protein CLUG_04172 [Clavispora lusitaniae ATCC 42720]|uniref:Polyprenal reductase n=1 Tax=Clavispora lusitaniae (strain ATCC 42720) TaxID=306902 RepID=C4Y7J4_CLAL4|nr:uncharacterized protein CLUG_04172 [Clavispora lusitaniae ATCC 42720]EEQ40044.1 hypothetical protein CLUG_04172 [Clavispora lusitaniae ATCC 42720]